MRRAISPFLVLVFLLALVPSFRQASAQQAPIVVTPGESKAFHAAVQQFRDDATPADPQRAAILRGMVGDGMAYSSVLLPLQDEAFLAPMQTTELAGRRRADCNDWTQSGADALVEGVIKSAGQDLVVHYQVWDTARCLRLREGKLRRPHNDMIRLAKLLADDVVEAFTGTAGVAGTEIAFISDRTGAREVWVMDADGGRQRKATAGASIKAFPDWMPDGKAILYTSYQDGSVPGLFLTSRGEYRPGPLLTKMLPGLPKYRGVFSPNGKQLALVTSFDGSAELYRVDRSGRNETRLTHSEAIDISPTWSPDGKQIAFVSDRSGAPQLYMMDPDGGSLRRLTFNGGYNTSPAWSPDGRWIAYEARIEGQFDIWLIDPSGEINLPLISHRRSDEFPAWSADSRKLAFASTRRGKSDIYVVDVNGDNLRRLTERSGANLQPSWGPFAD
jgi:TolB protein